MSAILDAGDWPDHEIPSARTGALAGDGSAMAFRHGPWAAIAVVLGGLAAGSSAFVLNMLRSEPSSVVQARLGDTRLALPAALLRSPDEVVRGAQARVDLLLSWPDLGPVAQRVTSARQSWGSVTATTGDEVQVTLTAAEDGIAPETRVPQLYARFLEPQVQQGPGELLTRHFKRSSPFAGEVLVFSPPDGRKVAARCESEAYRLDPAFQAPAASAAAAVEIPATCIAEFQRRGLAVQLRFPPRLAGGLEAVQRRLIALVDRLAG